jgi:hypothetical protein
VQQDVGVKKVASHRSVDHSEEGTKARPLSGEKESSISNLASERTDNESSGATGRPKDYCCATSDTALSSHRYDDEGSCPSQVLTPTKIIFSPSSHAGGLPISALVIIAL